MKDKNSLILFPRNKIKTKSADIKNLKKFVFFL